MAKPEITGFNNGQELEWLAKGQNPEKTYSVTLTVPQKDEFRRVGYITPENPDVVNGIQFASINQIISAMKGTSKVKISWQSADGFFGTEEVEEKDVPKTVRAYQMDACEVSVIREGVLN